MKALSTVDRLFESKRFWGGQMSNFLLDAAFRGVTALGRRVPQLRPDRHHVKVLRDVNYGEDSDPAHRLDIYRPEGLAGPLPVVIYIHGGGFRILSKESHWIFALWFARRGYLVFNINYRLAPKDAFPAALEDVSRAYRWVARHGDRFGGDLSRLVLAGESSGANLATGLSVSACYRRPEPWARMVWETERVPKATIPACGLLQVSDPERFERARGRRQRVPSWVTSRVAVATRDYLRTIQQSPMAWRGLADPLVVLEQRQPPDRPLPAFFAPCGRRDILAHDTLRLGRALRRLGVPARTRLYPGEPHAFHGLVWRPQAQACWDDTFAFLDDLWEQLAATRRPRGVNAAAL